MDARSLALTSTGFSFDEIAVEAAGGAAFESTIPATEAWAVASESLLSMMLPLGLLPASKEAMERSSVLMAGLSTVSDWVRSGQSSQLNSMVAQFGAHPKNYPGTVFLRVFT